MRMARQVCLFLPQLRALNVHFGTANASIHWRYCLHLLSRSQILILSCPSRVTDMPTVDDLLELPFFAETAEQRFEPGNR
jgi:hypothetical protein